MARELKMVTYAVCLLKNRCTSYLHKKECRRKRGIVDNLVSWCVAAPLCHVNLSYSKQMVHPERVRAESDVFVCRAETLEIHCHRDHPSEFLFISCWRENPGKSSVSSFPNIFTDLGWEGVRIGGYVHSLARNSHFFNDSSRHFL